MSEENKETALAPVNDFTMKDLETIEKFKENGLLGLHNLTDVDLERSMNLYLDGKSYRQISTTLKMGKDVILYLAHKYKWWEMRKEYLDELQATLKGKVIESKLQSQEFLLHLTLAYQKKIGKNIDKYLRTDDDKFADQIDSRDLTSLIKVIELLHRLNEENIGHSQNDKPLVGLSGMGDGVTITKTGPNSVDITPSNAKFGSKLRRMAEFKRDMEREASSPKKFHDITIEQPLTEKKEEEK